MRRFLAILATLILVSALAIPTLALESVIGKNAGTVQTTIAGVSSVKPKMDGIISPNEYKEVKFTVDDCAYFGDNAALLAEAQATKFKVYAAYDAENVYLAVVCDTPNYVSTAATKEKTSSAWRNHGLQITAIKANETTEDNYTNFAITRNSKTDDQIFHSYKDSYGSKWAPVGGKDFMVVTKNGVTTYEIAMPASIFAADSLKKGDTVRFDVCCLLNKEGEPYSCVANYGNATFGVRASLKTCTFTLSDAIVIPTTTTTTTTGTSPKTADPAVVMALVSVCSLASVVVFKKKH